MTASSKTILARELGISRGSLYYQKKQPNKDWLTKCAIELALRDNPSYGHKRLATHLKMNKKKTLRVMKLYGIKPYRRRIQKWKKNKEPFHCISKSVAYGGAAAPTSHMGF